ncbi:hypothetical protein GALMADRAFT_140593 [Galerina marginata CBS 339.88]|uniref:HNH nuclease domain-containing protein n=1 Tax=Galerina marginata (strain CBS 339.88) TaxID=685588 RepID=A0A067SVY8_GALM3|nr:hypothetical protein GALMADRAFT_140593 [Galerina marginata CBS 339.88]
MRAQKGTPLPPNIYPSGGVHDAYERCLEFEKAVDDIPLADLRKRLREARLLGYMIREAPTDKGRATIAKEILECAGELESSNLANSYINHIFLNFRAAKASIHTSSPTFSQPLFDNDQDILKWLLEDAPKSHSSTKAQALFRDGYRCTLIGHYDQVSVDTIQSFTDKNHEMWSAIERFAGDMITQDFKGKDVNCLDNVLTLESNKNNLFDELKIWFEEVRGPDCNIYPHQYRIGSANPFTQLMDVSPIINLNTPDKDNLPLPNPRYLRIHAACARVAYLSGVGKYIDDILAGIERRLAPALDGFDADVLSLASLLSDKIHVTP